MQKKFLYWMSNLILVFYVIILFISVGLMVKRINNPNEAPSFIGITPMVVLSGSMRPQINPGDLIFLVKIFNTTISEGDIATYKTSNNDYITHRVVSVFKQDNKTSYEFKGDSNNIPDEKVVDSTQLIGKVLFKIPYGGYLIEFIRSKVGIVLFIIIPILMLIGGEIKGFLSNE